MSAPSIVELQLKLNLQGLHYVTSLRSALIRVGGSEIRRQMDAQARSILGIEKAAQRAGSSLGGFSGTMGKLGLSLAGVWAVKRTFQAVGGAIEDALEPLMSFQHNMARVRVKGQLDATQTAAVSNVVKGMTGKTQFGPGEASEAAVGLAAAGFASPDKMRQALPTTLRFAQANDVSPEESTKILMGTMGQFHKGAGDLEHIGDLLSKTDAMSVLSVSQIFDTLKYVGPLAHQAKMPLEEVLAMVVSLGDAGINASKGGTGIRSLMSAVAAPTGSHRGTTADKQLKKIGMTRKDLVAGFSDIPALLARMDAAMSKHKFNPAESMQFRKVLFGQYGMTSAAALMGDSKLEEGQQQSKIQDIRGELAKTFGFMEKGAQTMAQTVEGRMKIVTAKWELLKINMGERFIPVIEKVIQKFDKFVSGGLGSEKFMKDLDSLAQGLMIALPLAMDVAALAMKAVLPSIKAFADYMMAFQTGLGIGHGYTGTRDVSQADEKAAEQNLYGDKESSLFTPMTPERAASRASHRADKAAAEAGAKRARDAVAEEARLRGADAAERNRLQAEAGAGSTSSDASGNMSQAPGLIRVEVNMSSDLSGKITRLERGKGPDLRVGTSSAL